MAKKRKFQPDDLTRAVQAACELYHLINPDSKITEYDLASVVAGYLNKCEGWDSVEREFQPSEWSSLGSGGARKVDVVTLTASNKVRLAVELKLLFGITRREKEFTGSQGAATTAVSILRDAYRVKSLHESMSHTKKKRYVLVAGTRAGFEKVWTSYDGLLESVLPLERSFRKHPSAKVDWSAALKELEEHKKTSDAEEMRELFRTSEFPQPSKIKLVSTNFEDIEHDDAIAFDARLWEVM